MFDKFHFRENGILWKLFSCCGADHICAISRKGRGNSEACGKEEAALAGLVNGGLPRGNPDWRHPLCKQAAQKPDEHRDPERDDGYKAAAAGV